ncbi:acetolactate decarboxylase [Herbidospora sp. NBRC 101105]|uniref:acetolactate decarboxylase n=1 Tax=Herbidospora sp. NBRC 101105 TaxID=3032195 RepID=UPI0024A1B64B|nr:acetolactate decarboxylase [Herbidospora sp. NBRC 101105]GLX99109.1 acetolactate decarboxylase [Herbidospora sp. NBRC 101105]
MEVFHGWARNLLAHVSGAGDARRSREIYQTSTMSALLEGVYEGDVTIGELLKHGDFGVGTFNRLDGEMLILDGVCHHLRADGSAHVAAMDEKTPFAVVTRFRPDMTIPVTSGGDHAAVTELIDGSVSSVNVIYAIRITGTFGQVHTRTVMEQTPPFPPLTEATKGQGETTFTDVRGTLAGFRTPDFEQGISVAGYHLHFVDESGRRGGHSLGFRLERGTIELSVRSEIHLSLPRTRQFLDSNLTSGDVAARIHQAEGG